MATLARLIAEEDALAQRNVPRRFYVYIAYNGYNDGLGTWTVDRAWIVADMKTLPNSLAYTVVDGRDKSAVTRHIYRSWDGHGFWPHWTREDSDKEYTEWLEREDVN